MIRGGYRSDTEEEDGETYSEEDLTVQAQGEKEQLDAMLEYEKQKMRDKEMGASTSKTRMTPMRPLRNSRWRLTTWRRNGTPRCTERSKSATGSAGPPRATSKARRLRMAPQTPTQRTPPPPRYKEFPRRINFRQTQRRKGAQRPARRSREPKG